MNRISKRAFVAPLAALAFAGCDATEALLHEPAPLYQGAGAVQFSLLGTSGLGAGEWLVADSVAVSVWRGASLVLDTTVAKSASATEIQLDVELPLIAEVDSFDIIVEARQGVVSLLRAFSEAEVIADRMTAVSVALLPVDAPVDGSYGYACGLDAGGAALCWGDNGMGQLGSNVPWLGVATPAPVATSERFRGISTSEGHVCAVSTGTGVHCWGRNDLGQLGTGSTTPAWPHGVTTPALVIGSSEFVRVTAGGRWWGESQFACGLTAAGAAFCWGGNLSGTLGNGSTTFSATPVAVSQPVPFRDIDAGTSSVCALGVDDRVYCWGANDVGQLGDGTLTVRSVPTPIAENASFIDVAVGGEHACAIATLGQAYCWGQNSDGGALGNGTQTDSSTPVAVSSPVAFRHIGPAWGSTCGVSRSSELYCWGGNYQGTLGSGSFVPGNQPTPILVPSLSNVNYAVGGGPHQCAVRADGQVYCWGEEAAGALGNGAFGFSSTPVAVGGLAGSYIDVAISQNHGCALQSGGATWCWGLGHVGQLGNNTFPPFAQPFAPVQVSGGVAFASISSGSEYTCGLTSAGAAYCWGTNWAGQLGDSANTNRNVPAPVAGGLTFTKLEAGSRHACGIAASGIGYCWGRNDSGQLGDGTTTDANAPVAVTGIANLIDIRPGERHTCATTSAGAGYCWGSNQFGELGNGTAGGFWNAPQAVAGGHVFTEVHAGGRENMADDYSCGLDASGAAWCWGTRGSCMLGNDICDSGFATSPVAVSGGNVFTDLVLGTWMACGITSGGQRYCWGNNDSGQLGVPHQFIPFASVLGTSDPGTARPTAGDAAAYVTVSTRLETSCGVTSAGVVQCWGKIMNSLFGTGDSSFEATPQPVSGGIVFGPGTGL